jgi:hypothetical protein
MAVLLGARKVKLFALLSRLVAFVEALVLLLT